LTLAACSRTSLPLSSRMAAPRR